MAVLFEIGPLLESDSWMDLLLLIFLYGCICLASFALLTGWFDLGAHIVAIQAAIAVAAAETFSFVRIDEEDPPPAPPAPADLQKLAAPPAYIPRYVSHSPPAQWAWERPGGLREYSERKIVPEKLKKRSQQDDDAIYEFLRYWTDLRKKQREDAAKKSAATPPPAATTKEIRPAAPAKPKRAFLSEPEGYTQAYTKFTSTFGAHITSDIGFVLENEAGHYVTSLCEITPPEMSDPIPVIEQLATSLGIKGSGHNGWISARTTTTAGTAPMNGAPATTTSFLRSNQPFQPAQTFVLPSNNQPAAHMQPTATTTLPAQNGGDTTFQSVPGAIPLGGTAPAPPPQSVLRSLAPPAAPMQPTTTTLPASTGGDATLRAGPPQPALPTTVPAAAPTQPATTTSLPAPTGGDTTFPAAPPPPVLPAPAPAPAPMQPTSGSNGAAHPGGDAPRQPLIRPDNPFVGKTNDEAADTIRKQLYLIKATLDNVAKFSKGPAVCWNQQLGKANKRDALRSLREHINHICDWATGSDGLVDTGKIPRAKWNACRLGSSHLNEMNNGVLAAWQMTSTHEHGKTIDNLLKAANRLENLFQ